MLSPRRGALSPESPETGGAEPAPRRAAVPGAGRGAVPVQGGCRACRSRGAVQRCFDPGPEAPGTRDRQPRGRGGAGGAAAPSPAARRVPAGWLRRSWCRGPGVFHSISEVLGKINF